MKQLQLSFEIDKRISHTPVFNSKSMSLAD